jgi:diguanylate cyclase (GGDEF)-like protein
MALAIVNVHTTVWHPAGRRMRAWWRLMNHIGIGRPGEGGIARAADQRVIDAEQSAAATDQTASDAGRTVAEREADTASDQPAAEPDQVSTTSRPGTRLTRAATSRSRSETAARRDAAAIARDETARRKDARAQESDSSIAASDASMSEKVEGIRARAAASRGRAAADREMAAQDRSEAADERSSLEAALNSAHLDDLTGAFHRGIGTVALAREIDRARRADGRFVIAFVDIDGMKQVNDRDGHAAGDHVLKTLVWTMRSNLRSFDPIVRYGGDEFVCGIGGIDLAEVERRFDAIGRALQGDVGVGISVGLAGLEPDDTLERLTARADAALLEAKKRRSE